MIGTAMNETTARRRRFQFHLGTLVVGMICAGALVGFGVHVVNGFPSPEDLDREVAKLTREQLDTAIFSELSGNPNESANALVRAVRLDFFRGDCIALARIERNSRFKANATDGSVGVVEEVLADGKASYGWFVHQYQHVYLYPLADAERVIALQHPHGNWIPYSPRNLQIIRDTLARLDATEWNEAARNATDPSISTLLSRSSD